MQFQPILELIDRKLSEEEEPKISDSTAKRGLKKAAEELVKPVKKDPHGFVRSYLDHTGRQDMTVGDLIDDLNDLAKKLKRKLNDSLQSELGYNGEIMLTEGFFSKLVDTLMWMGKPVVWVGKILWGAVSWFSDSWVGRHPIGRIAMGILFISFSDFFYTAMAGVLKIAFGSVHWLFPTTFILSLCLIMIVETIKLLGRLSSSASITEFLEKPEKPVLTYLDYFKGFIPGMRRVGA